MSKVVMLTLLVGALFYACWLVWRRRSPFIEGRTGKWRMFLLLTLFFMSWLGVPAQAGEAGSTTVEQRIIHGTPKPGRITEAMRGAWVALGIMAKWRYAEELCTDKEREQLRRAEEEYEKADEAYVKNGSPFWAAINLARDPARRKVAEEQYNRIGKPLNDARYEANDKLRAIRHKIEGRLTQDNRNNFVAALAEEKAAGRLSAGAAVLLETAYFHLDMHFDRGKATCYMGHPPIYKPRQDLQERISFLAQAVKRGTLSPDALKATKEAVVRDILTLYDMGEGKPVKGGRIGSGQKVVLDATIPDAQVPGRLQDYGVEAAEVLAELAVLLPADWGTFR